MNALKDISDRPLVAVCLLFAVALAFRLFFLFFISGVEYSGWYHDSYHHWQVAYYTLHVGLKQTPPGMWDLSGMEYFWGLLPTLTESFLLGVFNTASIAPFRIFNSVMGSLSVCLVFLLGKKHFSWRVGLFAALLAAVCPVLLEVDASGMLDPVGFAFLLLALLVYDRSPFACGFFLGLASLAHIEFWFLALGTCGCYLIFERSSTKFAPSVVGWLTPMMPYFVFLQTRTGDWLYALKYNYSASVTGEWITASLPLGAQVLPRAVAVGFLALAVAVLVYLVKTKPRGYIVHAFFWGFVAMRGVIFGLTAYIVFYLVRGQVPRLLMDRLFALNYYYISIIAALILLKLAAKRPVLPVRLKLDTKYVLLALTVIVYLSGFVPVTQQYFNAVYREPYVKQTRTADWINSNWQGGSVISSLVILNYRLIDAGFSHDSLFGSLYSPRYYGTENITESYLWLKSLNATWIVVDRNILENFPFLEGYPENHPPFHLSVKPPEHEPVYYVNQTELESTLP